MARSNDAKHDPVETPLSMSDVEKEARVVVPRSGRDSFRSELVRCLSVNLKFCRRGQLTNSIVTVSL